MSADTIARTAFKQGTKPLYDYDKHWASCYEPAPYLPMSRKEMDDLGWDACDVIIISGDAYVDHPSFGMAIIGRLLEAQGFRVGIIAIQFITNMNQTTALAFFRRRRIMKGNNSCQGGHPFGDPAP